MIRALLAMSFFTAVAAPLCADDKAKPALTAKEIADGWIMLFDGETTFGWKIEGAAEVKDGVLHIGGDKPSSATLTTEFGDYELRMETGPGTGSLCFEIGSNTSSVGLSKPSRMHADVHLFPDISQISTSSRAALDKIEEMEAKVVMSKPSKLRIEAPAGCSVSVKFLALRPLGTKPLFNGKNLDGWKVFADPKRAATRFTVTDAGELSAKNGPGDLQTEKQFDDFVLQLECKTNGKALNSGIFFRCIANQYQNGYEAQIQNAWVGDRTKPVDFGTGAIYRRVKARKVVSNDNEWFTLTVAARGAHFATWVNGYPTVDWMDTRKPNDNPRQGLRTARGHLSLQGHDPTTDLLFRNIRIAELPHRGNK